MPAAQPSRSSVSNVIGAIIAAGFQPGAVRVNADGSFCVDVADNSNQASSELPTENREPGISANADQAPSWKDGI